MNYDSFKVSCALLFDFDLAGFDEWLARMDDCPVKHELIERREKLVRRLSDAKVIKYSMADDDSCPALKRDAEFLKTQWLALRKEAVALPLVRKEQNRRANLPTAEEQYARWNEIAAQIRRDKPHLKKKTDIARAVRAVLSRSHDPRDTEFIKSVRTIRGQI